MINFSICRSVWNYHSCNGEADICLIYPLFPKKSRTVSTSGYHFAAIMEIIFLGKFSPSRKYAHQFILLTNNYIYMFLVLTITFKYHQYYSVNSTIKINYFNKNVLYTFSFSAIVSFTMIFKLLKEWFSYFPLTYFLIFLPNLWRPEKCHHPSRASNSPKRNEKQSSKKQNKSSTNQEANHRESIKQLTSEYQQRLIDLNCEKGAFINWLSVEGSFVLLVGAEKSFNNWIEKHFFTTFESSLTLAVQRFNLKKETNWKWLYMQSEGPLY